MNIKWKLTQDSEPDPMEPIGDIHINSFDHNDEISEDSVDLDFWLGAIIEGLAALFQQHSYSADLITEPYALDFVFALEGSYIKYKQHQIIIDDIMQASQEACTRAQQLIDRFYAHPRASQSAALLELRQKIETLNQCAGKPANNPV